MKTFGFILVLATIVLVSAYLPISVIKLNNMSNPWIIVDSKVIYSRGGGPGYVTVNGRTYYINEDSVITPNTVTADGSIINSHGIKVIKDGSHVLSVDDENNKLDMIDKSILKNVDSSKNTLIYTGITSKDVSELGIIVNLYDTTRNLGDNIPTVLRQGVEGYGLYIRSGKELDNIRKESSIASSLLDKIVQEALQSADKREQVKYVHDWLAKNVIYSDDVAKYTIYDTLYKKEVVCDGFARTFYQACRRLGLNVRYIHGTETNENILHAWNAVKFDGDSNWTYYDSTWDSTEYHRDGSMLYFEMSKEKCDRQHREECIHQ